MEKARYQHDCVQCEFLGFYDEYDLYFCMQGGMFPTVLARWGNDRTEYTSGLNSTSAPLVAAQQIAAERGRL